MRERFVPWSRLGLFLAVTGLALAASATTPAPGSGVGADPRVAPPAETAPGVVYRDLSASDTGFLGPGRELPPPPGLDSVRIGVLAPGERAAGRQLRDGVALAVAEANERGGYAGLPYEVVFRADDGPWGMGAKQVTALACEDSTWVIVGGMEGGDAHLAELVAAKLWIPVVTPTAGDLSIDYANVPWVFRCFPSDARQAELLLDWAAGAGHTRVLAFAEDDREGLTGTRRLEEAARNAGIELMAPLRFRAHLAGAPPDSSRLAEADAVVVWARPAAATARILALRRAGYAGPVLVPSTFLSVEAPPESGDLGEIVVAAALDPGRTDAAWRDFAERYEARSGRPPDAVALFAYDAACLVLAAVESAGLNRARIRDALARTDFEGIAGRLRFDGLGGAGLEPTLLIRREGSWLQADGSGRPRAVGGTD